MTAGDPPSHHANADARFFLEASISEGAWLTPVTQGYGAWDETNGHQFDFISDTTDTSNNANVYVTSATICGSPTKVGCTLAGASSSHHIVEGSALIQFKSTVDASLRDDVAAHEFGHYLGVGHSDVSSATMWPTIAASQSTLSSADQLGRCQIYGHSHAYWGGC